MGGTTSALTGGKFANGAITGAFSRAFNEGLHEVRMKKELAIKSIDEALKELDGFEFTSDDAKAAFRTAYNMNRKLDEFGTLNEKQIEFGLEVVVEMSTDKEIIDDLRDLAI